MDIQEKSAVECTVGERSPAQMDEVPVVNEPKISGFDKGSGSILKEPSLYLSVAVVLIGSAVTFSTTPVMVWIVFLLMSGLAGALHIIAERSLFASRAEHQYYSAPCEGVFVLVFGSILPGLSLFGYAIFSLFSLSPSSYLEALGKVALLLIVPLFNFSVWSAVRRRYLIRPRLTGLMNGITLGLSASWTIIWLKCLLFSQGPVSCKFGWMFLLFASPFMLFASVALGMDLWRRTEPRIARIAGTFSSVGVVLSFSFVFAPMVHSLIVQSFLTDATKGSSVEQAKAIAFLRCFMTERDLRPSKYGVSGFGLAQLLIPEGTLMSDRADHRDLYFKITGKPFHDNEDRTEDGSERRTDPFLAGSKVGPKTPGLSLAKSQISGSIDSATLSSTLDWTMSFRNKSSSAEEARGEMRLPPGAVVSRVTLWINGKPQEGAFAPTSKARAAYQSTVTSARDPLLVTMLGLDRILVQCWPVPANGDDMKVRIGFALPIKSKDGDRYAMELPQLLDTNFAQAKRHALHFTSRDQFSADNIGIVKGNKTSGHTLDGVVRNRASDQPLAEVLVERNSPVTELAVLDSNSQGRKFIVQHLQVAKTFAPRRLFVVIDSSASLQGKCSEIKAALASTAQSMSPQLYIASALNSDKANESSTRPIALKDMETTITPETFVGGQDNGRALRDALETASEMPGNAVVWVHGPQPLTKQDAESGSPDLINNLYFYDFEIQPGPNSLLESLRLETLGSKVTYVPVHRRSTVESDLKELFSGWNTVKGDNVVSRSQNKSNAGKLIVSDRSVCAQVACLWANEEVGRLLASGQKEYAEELGTKYHLVTPVTGAVVLEPKSRQPGSDTSFRSWDPWPPATAPSYGHSETYSGLVGAPVDPRYGQSNEVGQLADFGYDTARDIVRFLTLLSWLISIPTGIWLIRTGEGRFAVAKGVALIVLVPLTVHLIGTFMINNFGGLGGGL